MRAAALAGEPLQVRGVERLAHLAHAQAAAEAGEAARRERAQARAGELLDGDREAGAVAGEVTRLEGRDAEPPVAHPAPVDAAALDGAVEVREQGRHLRPRRQRG